MVSDIHELYSVVREIRNELRTAGEPEWGRRLDDAMHIGSTFGEVLGEIRVQLKGLQASPIAARLRLDGRIDKALEFINSILDSGST